MRRSSPSAIPQPTQPSERPPQTKRSKPTTSNNPHKPPAFAPRAQPQPSTTKPPPSIEQIRRYRKPALIGLSITAFAISFYTFYTLRRYRRAAASLTTPPPADAPHRFNALADTYDADLDSYEWLVGISKRRAQLLARARGNVLEMSCGTGRNASFYPLTRGVRSVTMVDRSREMVRVARTTWAERNAFFINAVFRVQSATEAVPVPVVASAAGRGRKGADGLAVREEQFDTVVQTMGICSLGDPVAVLRNMGRLCKPEGRILLLEHGRGHYEWLNRLLDEFAPVHAQHWGCWFNKDIGALVRESGLVIAEQKRYHLGTTWYFVLKPPEDRTVLGDTTKDGIVGQSRVTGQTEGDRPWWASWWT